MTELNILIIEDDDRWSNMLQDTLLQIGENTHVECINNFSDAISTIRNKTFDLITIDLSLEETYPLVHTTNFTGMQLLRDINIQSKSRSGCGIIILTGYPSKENVRIAFKNYNVGDFITKLEFDEHLFLRSARSAIKNARLSQAEKQKSQYNGLVITFYQNYIISIETKLSQKKMNFSTSNPVLFNINELRDRLSSTKLDHNDIISIMNDIYHHLESTGNILEELKAVKSANFPKIEIIGSIEILDIPIESLYYNEQHIPHICLLSRQIYFEDEIFPRNSPHFHVLVENLSNSQESLNILIVDVSHHSQTYLSKNIASSIIKDLNALDIDVNITILEHQEANYHRLSQELNQTHILYYVHHGEERDLLQTEGLLLNSGNDHHIITPDELGLLVKNTNMHFIHIDCPLKIDVRNKIIEKLLRSGIPSIMSYLWNISDDDSTIFSSAFYSALWQTFSLEEAAMYARNVLRNSYASDHNAVGYISPMIIHL